MKFRVVALAIGIATAGFCAGPEVSKNDGIDWAAMGRQYAEELKRRDPSVELADAIKKSSVSFYSTGSLMYGYRLPGLTEKEVRTVEVLHRPIVNAFPDDPAPFWGTKEYWDEVERFASAYNRLVFEYYKKAGPNQ